MHNLIILQVLEALKMFKIFLFVLYFQTKRIQTVIFHL